MRTSLLAHGDHVEAGSHGGALAATVHAADLAALGDSCATAISIDAVVSADAAQASGGTPAYSLRATLGLNATSGQGTGLGVAVIDSGIAPVADVGARITAFYDFTRGDIATVPQDEYGHGTHVAGLIAGNGASGSQYQGIAPNVRLIGLKVLDAVGQGRTSDVIRAIDFARTHKAALGIDVINLSLGHPIYEPAATDPLVQAVERAVRAGIVVVASAGNSGRHWSPAKLVTLAFRRQVMRHQHSQ